MKVYLTSFIGMTLDVDSDILIQALQKRGVESKKVSWDDPSVDWAEPDLCISKSTSNYIFGKDKPFREWMKRVEDTTPLWNTRRVMEWNLDKHYLKDLEEKGVPIPPTIVVERWSTKSLEEVLRDVEWQDLIIKPVISAGSFGLQRLKRGEDAEKHLRAVTNEGFTIEFQGVTYTSGPQAAIIQPFLQEIFGGEVSLIYFGRELCNSVLKIAKAGDIRSHPGYGAKVISHTPSPEELRVGDLVIDSVEEPHFARIDLVRTSMGPRVIEVELIEPFLFFDMFPETAEPFANHIIDFLKG